MPTTKSGQPTLRAQDPDLPLLAARAAIELDNLRRKKPTELNAVKMISDRLRNSLKSNGDKHRSILDSSTTAIVGRALHSAVPSVAVTSPDQLIDEARALAKKMGQLTTASQQPIIDTMRNFFVALSKCTTAYRQGIHDQVPHHKFRR